MIKKGSRIYTGQLNLQRVAMRLTVRLGLSWGYLAMACLVVCISGTVLVKAEPGANDLSSEAPIEGRGAAELQGWHYKRHPHYTSAGKKSKTYYESPEKHHKPEHEPAYEGEPGYTPEYKRDYKAKHKPEYKPDYMPEYRPDSYQSEDRPKSHSKDSYCIGLWGDLPYSILQTTTGVPNLIADMNSQDLAFSVYDGDWKAGSPVNTAGSTAILNCSDALYTQQIQNFFDALDAPAMYAPGDNEWTDCDRSNAFGRGFNSLNRLTLVRRQFFDGNPFSQGKKKLRQEVQTDTCLGWAGVDPFNLTNPAPTFNQACTENRRWTYNGVMFITINMVGSNNNLGDQFPDPAEYKARNDANIKWMRESFALATARNLAGIMIIAQADPGFGPATLGGPCRDAKTLKLIEGLPAVTGCNGQNASIDGFFDWLVALRELVIAFKKPVTYVHGDSHYFVIDKPLLDDQGVRLVNFTRLMTFGDNQANGNNDVNWVKVEVDPKSRYVFEFAPMIVKANNPSQVARRRL